MAETEKLGIQNIEDVLTFCLDLGLQVAKDLEDKKISTGEAISLALKLPKAISTVKKIKAAILEAKDLDSEEISTLLALIIEKLDLKPE